MGVVNGDIVNNMKVIHDYIRKNNYDYGSGCHSIGLRNDNDVKKLQGIRNIDCSAYVSWVLYVSNVKIGMVSSDYFYKGTYKNNTSYKWTTIDKSQGQSALQPGDILSRDGHVEFYRGNGTVYCAGGKTCIRNEYSTLRKWDHAIRISK